MLKFGIIGMNEGNGHPYSFTAAFNGFNADALAEKCSFPIIREYLTAHHRNQEFIPDAEVKLAMYNKRFTVLGDANSGTYNIYKERMTIFQALAMSGDLMNSGDRRHVRIVRPRGNAEPEVLEFDIRTNTIIDSKYYYVYPNDLIYVSRDKGSFYKQSSYSGFLALITSSVSLLITVLNYIPGVW